MEPTTDRPADPTEVPDELTQADLDLVESLTGSLQTMEHARVAINLARRTAVELANIAQVDGAVWRAINAVLCRAFQDVLRSWPQEP
jgi:hypothetical protein